MIFMSNHILKHYNICNNIQATPAYWYIYIQHYVIKLTARYNQSLLRRKAKRMVLQCNNGVGSNPVEGRTKI